MNHSQTRYLLALAAVMLFALGFAFAWGLFLWVPSQVAPGEPISGTALMPVGVALIVLLWTGTKLYRSFNSYLFTVKQLAEGMTLILTANPAHRVKPEGPAEVQQLARTINSFGAELQAMRAIEAEKIRQAQTNLEAERNRLAALMSELAEGVLVCNMDGRILLYNNQARQLFGRSAGFIGLGRSIFGLIDHNIITHALERLTYRVEQQQHDHLFTQFVTASTGENLLRVRMSPVLSVAELPDEENKQPTLSRQYITGYILTLEDITLQIETGTRQDTLLRNLVENVRASIGNVRAAIEMMRQFPEMDASQVSQFRGIIYDESVILTRILNQTLSEHDKSLKEHWQLENVRAIDLLLAVNRYLETKFDLRVPIENRANKDMWLRIDSYSIVQAIVYMVHRLQTDFEAIITGFEIRKTGRFVNLDIVWQAKGMEADNLSDWRHQQLLIAGEGTPLTLDEVLERHGGEAWFQADRTTSQSRFRLLVPTIRRRPVLTTTVAQPALDSRPEYYDFNLFEQPGQLPEVDQQKLTDLTYTVFDTETTGLNPEQDEIISIGATRIVNGRLLRQELFEQLVDPKRSVSDMSVRIHHIQPEMLRGQPPIEQVLPQFQRFAEGTILVGHNAAFDMRMFQVKEKHTKVKLTCPVLDTLLLSAVVHPNQSDHSIEAISQRLGIKVIGRHTALGDAMVTGEIFLKLVPLLAEQGITTLLEARQASEETYYARLQY